MSTNNAARFYWAKLERATTLFDRGALEEAHDVCCQLGNEHHCPRFCQTKAWKLGSRWTKDNYWFAKGMLDSALKVVAGCEASDEADDDESTASDDWKVVEGEVGDRPFPPGPGMFDQFSSNGISTNMFSAILCACGKDSTSRSTS